VSNSLPPLTSSKVPAASPAITAATESGNKTTAPADAINIPARLVTSHIQSSLIIHLAPPDKLPPTFSNQLKELTIQSDQMRTLTEKDLASILLSCPNLTALHFRNVTFKTKKLPPSAHVPLIHLRELTITEHSITETMILIPMLAPNLRRLNLILAEMTGSALLSIALCFPRLEALTFGNKSMVWQQAHIRGFAHLLTKCPNLTSLDMPTPPIDQADSLLLLKPVPKLTRLSLFGENISEELLLALSAIVPNLEEASFPGHNLVLLQQIFPNLKKLSEKPPATAPLVEVATKILKPSAKELAKSPPPAVTPRPKQSAAGALIAALGNPLDETTKEPTSPPAPASSPAMPDEQ
jgi:hypothetical protein